jgi:thioesterase domain-containing protein
MMKDTVTADRSESEQLDNGFSLTSAQEAIWLDQRLHPGKPIYNCGERLEISTEVDTVNFAEAVRIAVGEFDALRLRFRADSSGARQIIMDRAETDLQFIDLSSEYNPDAAAEAWIDSFFWSPFELEGYPLYQFALIKLSERRFFWVSKYHHLINDASGRKNLSARIADLYNARLRGDVLPRSKTRSYQDVQEEQQKYFPSREYEIDRAYWKSRLSGLPLPPKQGIAARSERARSGRPTRLEAKIAAADFAALRSFAKQQGFSVFRIMLAISWAYFSNLYNASELVFGIPLANREDPRNKGTVGLFSSVMPFRTMLERKNMSFGSALSKLSSDFDEDFQHRQFPIAHITGLPELRHLERQNLCQIWVNYIRADYGFEIRETPVIPWNISSAFTGLWGFQAFDYGQARDVRLVLDYDSGRIDGDLANIVLEALRGMLSVVSEHIQTPSNDFARLFDRVSDRSRSQANASGVAETSPLYTNEVPGQSSGFPRDENDSLLIQLWRNSLGRQEIDPERDFFDMGGSSLKAVLLIDQCAVSFGVDLPASTLFDRPATIARMAAAIRQQHLQSNIFRLKAGSDTGAVPLLLIHPVGGTIFCYADLISRLSGNCTVYGLQASGVQKTAERLPASLQQQATEYIRAFQDISGTPHCHLAGWSYGGVVAFEMAIQLAAMKHPAAGLTLLDTRSSVLPMSGNDPAAIAQVAEALGLHLTASKTDFSRLPIDEAVAALRSQAGSQSISEEFIRRMLAVIENNRMMRRRYSPGRLNGHLTLIRAELEPGVSEEDYQWQQHVDGRVTSIPVPATHASIVRPPCVDTVAAIMNSALLDGSSQDQLVYAKRTSRL